MEPETIPLIDQQHPDSVDIDDRDAEDAIPLKREYAALDRFASARKARRWAPSTQSVLAASALVVSLLSLLWNVYAFSSAYRTYSRSGSQAQAQAQAQAAFPSGARPQHAMVGALRKPSIYLGLERVPGYRKGPAQKGTGAAQAAIPAGPGLPTALARVNARYPDVAFEQDGWVLLSEDDRTLMTFPVPNPGSQCAFLGRFPRRTELGLESPVQMLTIERDDLNVSHPSVPSPPAPQAGPEIHFTALAVPFPTSPLNTSLTGATYATRPPARAALGALVAAFGTNSTTVPFPCPRTGALVVEAACRGGGCRVEYTYPNMSVSLGPSGFEHPPVPLGITLVQV